MEGLLILAMVAGVAIGVGFTTWQLSRQVKSKRTWVVDAAEDLSALEKCLNHFSEEDASEFTVSSPSPHGLKRSIRRSSSPVVERSAPCRSQAGSDSGRTQEDIRNMWRANSAFLFAGRHVMKFADGQVYTNWKFNSLTRIHRKPLLLDGDIEYSPKDPELLVDCCRLQPSSIDDSKLRIDPPSRA